MASDVQRDLDATAKLIDAMRDDPRLLNDEEFNKRFMHVCDKHAKMVKYLERKLGVQEVPRHSCHLETSESTYDIVEHSSRHHRFEERLLRESSRRRSPMKISPTTDIQGILNDAMMRHFVKTPSERRQKSASGTSGALGKVRLKPAKPSHIPTSSAMPSGLLMTSTLTKHVPLRQNLATSSNVVEESFLDDGLSTTRDVPTIVDEAVELETKMKTKVRKPVKSVVVTVPKRSKSMQNVSVPRNEFVPTNTVPKPFQLSLRKSIENTYAKKFMSSMMEEKKKQEELDAKSLRTVKFRAKPVPKSTYAPTNTFATEIKYVETMRRKVEKMAKKKFDVQSEMVRSKSEGNLATIKPPGYVPPSTYISPIPVKPNARSRSATQRSAILIQEALTPKGIKSHRVTSNLTHHLRHGRCKLDTSAVIQHRRMSPPDFQKIHAKVQETYNHLSGRPSTVPIPFKFASRSQSSSSRHTNCREKEPELFKKSEAKRAGSGRPVPSTHAAQLREELNRAKFEKEKNGNGGGSGEFWKEDNRKRIASFLGSRSKTDEDIAIRTRRKIKQQQETTQDYMRKLAEMKQRVLSGPLIMEKQSALAQEHRLKRKFAARMKTASENVNSAPQKSTDSRRMSETSAAGTFVVEKEYAEDFEEEVEEEDSEGSSEESEESSGKSGSESQESESEDENSSGEEGV